jgi:tetratricopeptide (TPR) repeat protein
VSEISTYVAYDVQVDSLQHQLALPQLCLTTHQPSLSESRSKEIFHTLDTLSVAIDQSRNTPQAIHLLLKRAIAYTTIQNYQAAIEDLTICLLIDSTSVVALWLRAACQDRVNEFQASEGVDIRMKTANVLVDLEHAVRMAPNNAYLYYNRGNIFFQRKDFREAEADYTRAIGIDGRLAEAYFNRGLCRVRLQCVADAIADFSKAGELGLYTAYAMMKKYSK